MDPAGEPLEPLTLTLLGRWRTMCPEPRWWGGMRAVAGVCAMLLLVLAAGCSAPSSSTTVTTNPPTTTTAAAANVATTSTPTTVPAARVPDGWQLLERPDEGLEFAVPADWIVDPDYSGLLVRSDPAVCGCFVEVVRDYTPVFEELRLATLETMQSLGWDVMTVTESDVGGHPALVIEGTNDRRVPFREVLVVAPNSVHRVQCMVNDEGLCWPLVGQIMDSYRVIDEPVSDPPPSSSTMVTELLPDSGFRIAFPDDWIVLNFESDDIEVALAAAEGELHPQSFAWASRTGRDGSPLVAFGPRTTSVQTSVIPIPHGVDPGVALATGKATALEARIALGETIESVEEGVIAGLPAVIITSKAPDEYYFHLDYRLATDAAMYQFVFSTNEPLRDAQAMDSVLQTFEEM